MNLSEIISKRTIISQLDSKDKTEVLSELIQPLLEIETGLDRDKLVEILLEREKLGSTGIGDGIAIPHGKVSDTDKLLISFGRSKSGIDFDSIDGQPAFLFFLLLAPDSSTGSHLKALAKLSRLLKDPGFRDGLLTAEDEAAIFELILSREENL